MWQRLPHNSFTLDFMMSHFALALKGFAQGVQEDGALPGEGLSAIETFTYFFAVPAVLFVGISLLTYALTGERKKKQKVKSVVTSID